MVGYKSQLQKGTSQNASAMKTTHSKSLLLVWEVAEIEARRLGATELRPEHLLIGLTKSVDVNWLEAIKEGTPDRPLVMEEMLREMRRLRERMLELGINPIKTRRALRRKAAKVKRWTEEGKLHRTETARKTFKTAEKLATLEGHAVYPLDLLDGLLSLGDAEFGNLISELGIKDIDRGGFCGGRQSPPAINDQSTWN